MTVKEIYTLMEGIKTIPQNNIRRACWNTPQETEELYENYDPGDCEYWCTK